MIFLALSSLSAIAWSTSRFSASRTRPARVVFLLDLVGVTRPGHHVVDRHQHVGEGAVLGDLELGLVGSK
jgi:hypothetical protein